jgi:hypothetical protein
MVTHVRLVTIGLTATGLNARKVTNFREQQRAVYDTRSFFCEARTHHRAEIHRALWPFVLWGAVLAADLSSLPLCLQVPPRSSGLVTTRTMSDLRRRAVEEQNADSDVAMPLPGVAPLDTSHNGGGGPLRTSSGVKGTPRSAAAAKSKATLFSTMQQNTEAAAKLGLGGGREERNQLEIFIAVLNYVLMAIVAPFVLIVFQIWPQVLPLFLCVSLLSSLFFFSRCVLRTTQMLPSPWAFLAQSAARMVIWPLMLPWTTVALAVTGFGLAGWRLPNAFEWLVYLSGSAMFMLFGFSSSLSMIDSTIRHQRTTQLMMVRASLATALFG